MPLLWVGAVLLALKALGVEPVAGWSWWWVLSPFALTVIWWEWLERLLGFDRRRRPDDRPGALTRKGR
ncbi:MAG: hypothetical protein RLZ51_1071 [Pseudomonadota bacterium]